MITIRYNTVIVDGQEKTGKVETVSDEIAHRLVKQGYASIVEEMAVIQPGETRGGDPSAGGHFDKSSDRINPEDIPFNHEASIFKETEKTKRKRDNGT